jgi:hypothetical protein
MRWVTATQLENWAQSLAARDELPMIVADLITPCRSKSAPACPRTIAAGVISSLPRKRGAQGGCRDLDRLDSRLRGNDERLPRQAVNPS